MSRPSRFNDAITDTVRALYEKGKTDGQVAEIIGVSIRTLHYWKAKHPDFLHAIKDSKQVADDLVEASLFSRAVGYSHPEEKIFQHEGEIIRAETVKQYPPDPTAMIFWLKNRRPEEWREKQPGEDDKTVTLAGEVELKTTDIKDRIKQLKDEPE